MTRRSRVPVMVMRPEFSQTYARSVARFGGTVVQAAHPGVGGARHVRRWHSGTRRTACTGRRPTRSCGNGAGLLLETLEESSRGLDGSASGTAGVGCAGRN
ncbi:hypothetical protein [Streptomyces sp. NPDC005262]|uniref:hypothetical protein n=1 Tax=Streptomyces sp. NPDC005262 TaxID=3364710 RepID=UPI0036C57432